jgi:hypothetical protein
MATLDEQLAALGEGLPSWQKALRAGSRSIQSLGSESINAAKSLATAGDAAEKMGGVFDAGNRLIGATLGQLPVIGGAVAGSASLITDAFKGLINILQSGYQDFAELSKVGAAGTQTLTEIKDSAKDAGIALFNFGKYTDIIKENSSVMAMYGGTVGQARQQFDGLLKAVHHVEGRYTTQMLLMGMNQEQIMEFAGGWTKILARTGRAQNMSVDQMAASTMKAAKEMDVLSRLTGIQKDELLKEQEAALSYSRFRMAYRQAEKSGDEEQLRHAKRAMELWGLAKDAPQLQKAIADTFTGVLTTGEAVGAQILTGGGLREAIFADASIGTAETMVNIGHLLDSGLDKFGPLEATIGYIGDNLNQNAANIADVAKIWKTGDLKAAKKEQVKRLKDEGSEINKIVEGIKNLEKAREKIDEKIIELLQKGAGFFKGASVEILAGATKFNEILTNIQKGWQNFSKTYIGRKLFGDLTEEDKLATGLIKRKGKGEFGRGAAVNVAMRQLAMEQVGAGRGAKVTDLTKDQAQEYHKIMREKIRDMEGSKLTAINKRAAMLQREKMLKGAGTKIAFKSDLQEYLRDKFLSTKGDKYAKAAGMEKMLDAEGQLEIIEKMGLDADKQNKLLEDIRNLMGDQLVVSSNN